MNKFKDLGLSRKVLDIFEDLNFSKPTEIQFQTIPQILDGKDLIGNAATGSGKTLAFISGIIEKLVSKKGIQALVLTPTRELTIQIAQVTRPFAKNASLKIQEIYGGVSIFNQIRGAKNAEILIGTPGRMLDHLQRGSFDLQKIKILVLDEADRMVDMGFLPDVERIIKQCPKEKQTLLFSATSSPATNYIAEKYMKKPMEITVKRYVEASKLHQFYYDTPAELKFSLLVDLLKREKSGIIMIFCNTRRNVDLIAKNLQRYSIDSQAIHGGLSQDKRNKVITQFHQKKSKILVCTDVAARGLDIKGVTHVYNYDLPKTSEEYIHRIGRTARAGEEGLAISILSGRDYSSFGDILQDPSIKIERKELPKVKILKPDFKDRFSRRTSREKRAPYKGKSLRKNSYRSRGKRTSREPSRNIGRKKYGGNSNKYNRRIKKH